MDAKTREFIRQRAGYACEYCRIPQAATPLISFHIEHVTAKQHGGTDNPDDLALACDRCNAYKGPNLTTIDQETGDIVALYHPRRDKWAEHFTLRGYVIVGLTAVGRATVRLLNMNSPRRVELRAEWLKEANS
jgi:hypothetical protein